MSVKKPSYRMRFVFWLDVAREDEHELADYVEDLKAKRSFAKTVRDGLRLMRDLRAGNIDVLCELFPMIAERFQPKATAETSELAALVEQFKVMMVTRPAVPTLSSPMPIAAPVVVTVNKDEAIRRSVENTIAAMEDF